MQLHNEEQSLSQELKPLLSSIIGNSDSGVFDELYYLLQNKLFLYIISRVHDRDNAKDILQDIFVDLWKALQNFSYKSDAQFYGFVFTITKRKISRYLQLNKKNTHISLEEHKYVEQIVNNFSVSDNENIDIIKDAVANLKEKYSEVVMLRHWSGLSFLEIGEIVGSSEQSVRVRHHRALEMLRTCLQSRARLKF